MLQPIAAAIGPGTPPTLHVLLTGVQTGPLALAADAVEAAALLAYALGVRRLQRRGRRWPVGAAAGWAAGVAVVWVAIGSGLAAYDDVDISLHVVQHILLMMVAAPLLALGRPLTMAAQAAGRPVQRRVVRLANSRLLHAVTHPVPTTAVYYGTMYGFFLSPLYAYAVTHQLFHDATHLVFLGAGYLYWQPLVGGDPGRSRRSHMGRIVTLLVGSPFEGVLGVVLSGASWSISPINTVAQTQAGGQVFLAMSMLASGLWALWLGWDWLADATRTAGRDDRRAALAVADSRRRLEVAATAAGTTEAVPAGWWIPEWRIRELEQLAAGDADDDVPPLRWPAGGCPGTGR